MNANSCEIRRINIKSFFNRRCLEKSSWYCYRYYFLLFSQRASLSTFNHPFVRALLCFAWLFISLPSIHFKFKNVSNHSRGRSFFTSFIFQKEGIPTALEGFLRFDTKRRILYFLIPHNALCLSPKVCIKYCHCCEMKCPWEVCIFPRVFMGNLKIENKQILHVSMQSVRE